jgi:hypothetical protein
MLYLSHVPFEKIGFPKLDDVAPPDLTWPWMAAVPWVALGMGSLMAGIYWYTRRGESKKEV